MSHSPEVEPLGQRLRVTVTNFLQKYRGPLLALVGTAAVVLVGLAIWSQVDQAVKTDFAAKIDKSQNDYAQWKSETDATKKAAVAKTLEEELALIQKTAPQGYGLSKAWFLQGSYEAAQKRWPEAAKAYRTAYDKDPSSYLAPVALVNAGASQEEAGQAEAALATYALFLSGHGDDAVLAPQVFFTQGRLFEAAGKTSDAVASYKKLLEKYPESNWTKLGRDRILLLTKD